MQNIPKIVRARLQRPTAESHPDADLLTAFAEQALTGRERDDVVEHLSRCSGCREVVALALPATEAVMVTSEVRSARANWFSWPVLRWGVVTAGILAVTSVGVLQYRQRHQEKTLVATRLMSQDQLAETAAQTPAPSPHTSAPQAIAPATEMGKPAEMAKKTAARERMPSRAQSAFAADKAAPSANAILPRARPAVPASPAGATGAGSGIGSGAGRVVNFEHVSPPQADEHLQVSADQPETVGKAKPASNAFSYGMAPAPMLHAEPSLLKNLAVPRWSISDSGRLQRSLDGGKTWLDVEIAVDDSMNAKLARPAKTEISTQAQTELKSQAKPAAKSMARYDAASGQKSADSTTPPAASTIFRAVSVSPNAAEVWAGGSGGALYHTMDGGNRWTRVVPADAGAVLTGDVVSIQFSDQQNGTVTTSAAELWTTADDGQTWHRQQ